MSTLENNDRLSRVNPQFPALSFLLLFPPYFSFIPALCPKFSKFPFGFPCVLSSSLPVTTTLNNCRQQEVSGAGVSGGHPFPICQQSAKLVFTIPPFFLFFFSAIQGSLWLGLLGKGQVPEPGQNLRPFGRLLREEPAVSHRGTG